MAASRRMSIPRVPHTSGIDKCGRRNQGRWAIMVAMGSFLLRAALTGLALWVVTLLVPGIGFVGGGSTVARSASSSSSR